MNEKLPKVAYLTLLDKNVLGTFVLLFLTSIETWIVYIIDVEFDNRPVARMVDIASWIVFPALSILLQFAFFYQAGWFQRHKPNCCVSRQEKMTGLLGNVSEVVDG